MAFALVNTFFSGFSAIDLQATLGPIDTFVGNLMVVGVSYPTGAAVIVSDAAGNNYQPLAGSKQVGTTQTAGLYAAANTVLNHTNTITVDGDIGGEYAICAMQFSGGATGTPFDKASGANPTGTGAISAPSISPAGSGELSVSFIMVPHNAEVAFTGTPGSGYTSPDNAGWEWGEYNLSVSTGQVGDWSVNVNQNYYVLQALFSTTNIVAGGGPRLLAATGVGN